MKPCATSARLLSSARLAMSSWARADAAFWSACCTRRSASSVSSWPITWPAFTVSPSRTVSDLTSAATLARTTALSEGLQGRPRSAACGGRSACVPPPGRRRSVPTPAAAWPGQRPACAPASGPAARGPRSRQPAGAARIKATHPHLTRFIFVCTSCGSSDGGQRDGRAPHGRAVSADRRRLARQRTCLIIGARHRTVRARRPRRHEALHRQNARNALAGPVFIPPTAAGRLPVDRRTAQRGVAARAVHDRGADHAEQPGRAAGGVAERRSAAAGRAQRVDGARGAPVPGARRSAAAPALRRGIARSRRGAGSAGSRHRRCRAPRCRCAQTGATRC